MPARSCALLVHLLRLDDGGTMAGDTGARVDGWRIHGSGADLTELSHGFSICFSPYGFPMVWHCFTMIFLENAVF